MLTTSMTTVSAISISIHIDDKKQQVFVYNLGLNNTYIHIDCLQYYIVYSTIIRGVSTAV